MTAAAPKPTQRRRRVQERAEITREKLLNAAKQLFSERGFDAVSVRELEIEAGVQRNLLKYHFGSKEGMWQAAVADLLVAIEAFRQLTDEVIRDLSPHEALAYQIRSYVRFSAANPELSRIMMQEGKHHSWRIAWLVETMLKPATLQLKETVLQDIDIEEDEFVSWYYMFISAGSFIFSMAPEAKLLFGVDTRTDDVIDRHARMMVEFLLSRAPE
ncbi:MAG: TetR family transcriptional regulator [Pseudomonadota bacterium]